MNALAVHGRLACGVILRPDGISLSAMPPSPWNLTSLFNKQLLGRKTGSYPVISHKCDLCVSELPLNRGTTMSHRKKRKFNTDFSLSLSFPPSNHTSLSVFFFYIITDGFLQKIIIIIKKLNLERRRISWMVNKEAYWRKSSAPS